jgi:hypothetical protein
MLDAKLKDACGLELEDGKHYVIFANPVCLDFEAISTLDLGHTTAEVTFVPVHPPNGQTIQENLFAADAEDLKGLPRFTVLPT